MNSQTYMLLMYMDVSSSIKEILLCHRHYAILGYATFTIINIVICLHMFQL